ncbi:hypothetical protein [Vibrio fluvialis]|uniref:hypothetical protein n=1 Tax=Vibrio fluvialis TaxID=676 RepID=UPI0028DF840D|nr:hypothetical protein [Vibrio fluvialis]MDT8869186.1 hypothetical protein [Vibrio fluvialis]MDT8876839.1 hypothetical protein [Vibrio fluvialis]
MTDSVDLTFINDGTHFHFKLHGETILSVDSSAIDHAKAEDIYIGLLRAMWSVLS